MSWCKVVCFSPTQQSSTTRAAHVIHIILKCQVEGRRLKLLEVDASVVRSRNPSFIGQRANLITSEVSISQLVGGGMTSPCPNFAFSAPWFLELTDLEHRALVGKLHGGIGDGVSVNEPLRHAVMSRRLDVGASSILQVANSLNILTRFQPPFIAAKRRLTQCEGCERVRATWKGHSTHSIEGLWATLLLLLLLEESAILLKSDRERGNETLTAGVGIGDENCEIVSENSYVLGVRILSPLFNYHRRRSCRHRQQAHCVVSHLEVVVDEHGSCAILDTRHHLHRLDWRRPESHLRLSLLCPLYRPSSESASTGTVHTSKRACNNATSDCISNEFGFAADSPIFDQSSREEEEEEEEEEHRHHSRDAYSTTQSYHSRHPDDTLLL
uniref:Uncharacterized protein n=1 Tax=Echinococcus granulosus TaxID=6210 RepID=A0A068X1W0_ECHGR|nr:hypothetical protein EgrG_002047700 [Echinococcus granulosus]